MLPNQPLACVVLVLCACVFACRAPTPRAPTPPVPVAQPVQGVRLNPPLKPALPQPAPVPEKPPGLAPLPADAIAHDAIVIAGQRFSIGAPVVLWSDPGGYSAYAPAPFFDEPPRADAPSGLRFRPGRKRGDDIIEEPTLADLTQIVDQFVLHFDVCGVSRQCFKVLQDIRGLSVHFLLDIDGTLYQTLDLRETAWHARQANGRSIGVEIANMGAYPVGQDSALDHWYVRDAEGWRIQIPDRLEGGGVRSADFTGRPARRERVQGVIQEDLLEQFDFTSQQYDTLVKLSIVLCQVLPKIEPDSPRDSQGRVRTDALEPAEFEDFHGILGHYHVTREKNDPGPAMDWEPFLEGVRAQL